MHYQIRGHFKGIQPQVGKAGNILILPFIKNDRDLVNNRMLSIFLDLGLDIFALIRADIVFAQDTPDLLKSGLDGFLIVSRAIHAQQVFKYISRNVCALFHQCCQILPDDLAGKVFQQLLIKSIHEPCSPSPSLRNQS